MIEDDIDEDEMLGMRGASPTRKPDLLNYSNYSHYSSYLDSDYSKGDSYDSYDSSHEGDKSLKKRKCSNKIRRDKNRDKEDKRNKRKNDSSDISDEVSLSLISEPRELFSLNVKPIFHFSLYNKLNQLVLRATNYLSLILLKLCY